MKRAIKLLMIVCIAWVISGPVQGQEIAAPSGGQFKKRDYQIDWTLGESAIQTFEQRSVTLTSGFHQPELLITEISDAVVSTSIITVFPNPAMDHVVISVAGELPDRSYARLYDMLGQLLQLNELKARETYIPLTSFTTGNYILKISQNDQETHQFKIIKTLR